jgi:hypothetical protein
VPRGWRYAKGDLNSSQVEVAEVKLQDMIARRLLLQVACVECRTTTLRDPAYFAARLGGNLGCDAIKGQIDCPACGASDVRLKVVAPERREIARHPAH